MKTKTVGKKYKTSLANFRPELQPNGRIVECIEDMKNGFLVVKSNDNTYPNMWLTEEKDLTEIKPVQ